MLIRHSATYFAARIVSGASSLVAVALYTRLLTADGYGQYALVMAAAVTVNAVLLQWLSLSLGRQLAAGCQQEEELLSTALVGYCALVVATATIGVATAVLHPRLRQPAMLVVAISAAQGWFDLNLAVANARLTPTRYAVLSSIKAIGGLSVAFALLVLGMGYLGPLLALFAALSCSPLVLRGQWRRVSLVGWRGSIMRDLLAYGAPLALTFVMIVALDVADRFIIGWLMTPSAVGLYAAAYDLANQSLGALLNVVHLAAFPLAVRAFGAQGEDGARLQLQRNLVLLTAIALPATAGVVLLRDNIASTVLGVNVRAQASEIMPLVAIGVCIWGIKAYYLDYAFQLKKRLAIQIVPNAAAALINVLLNVILIPRFGLEGAAWATVAAYAVGALLTYVVAGRIFRFPPLSPDIYKTCVAVSGMVAFLFCIRGWRGVVALALQITGGIAVYAALMLMLNVAGGWGKIRGNLVIFKGAGL